MGQFLTDGIVRLRALEPTDLDTLVAWENDTSLWWMTDTVAPMSRAVLWQYLQNDVADIYRQGELRLVVETVDGGEVVGMIDLRDYDALNNRVQLGIVIAANRRGEGLGTRALTLTCDYARDHLGLRQIYATLAVDNEACRRLLAHCGFEVSGTLRQWIRRGTIYRDAEIWQLVNE